MKADEFIKEAETAVLNCLSEMEKGYGLQKWAISQQTKIPQDLLTPVLRRLKYAGKIELIMIWSEETCRPAGSGYCITENLNY